MDDREWVALLKKCASLAQRLLAQKRPVLQVLTPQEREAILCYLEVISSLREKNQGRIKLLHLEMGLLLKGDADMKLIRQGG